MTPLARRPPARQAAGVLLALLAVGVVAPAARASCGDYVTIGGRLAETPAHPAHSPGPAPCSGPLCSRHVPQPTPTPLAPAPERGDQWGCVPAAPVAEDEAFAPMPADVPGHPVRQGLTVYHPPR